MVCGPTSSGILIGVFAPSATPSITTSSPGGSELRRRLAAASAGSEPSGSSTTRKVWVSAADSSSDVSHAL